MIPDEAVRARLFARVEPLLHGLPSSLATEAAKSTGLAGRFVRIELPGKSRVLTLAEVEVISGGKNIAPEGHARQASTNFNGQAQKAIDGNKSGTYSDGGQTHTAAQDNPWWELDLKSEQPIESISIWNRSENNGQYTDRLNGYTLTILDAERKPVFERKQQSAPRESVQLTVSPNPVETIRRAAIDAVTSLPGHEAAAFATLAKFVKENVSRGAAVSALARIPRSKVPGAEVRPLIDSLMTYVQTVPVAERTQTEVAEAIRLGKDLTAVLPQDEGRALFMKLRELGVDVFVIRPIRDRMEFDRKQLFVEAGKPFEIIFDNIDIMPHNLVVTAQGAREEIGILAEKMGATPEGMAQHFVPKSPKVLAATTMLQTGQQQRLQIVAPTQIGDYPFVCTFPGHWRTMYGTIHVVGDVSQIPLEPTETPLEQPAAVVRAFVRKWQVADLTGALAELDKGRSHDAGRKLFLSLACSTCHQIRGEGGKVGPDLTEVSKKLAEGKLTRAGLLTEMIEPSKVIAEQFRTQIILTDRGTLASGVVVFENDQLVRIVANPLDKESKPQEIAKQHIEERTASATSIMPEGLLNTLTRDEILDLLSYIVTAGESGHKYH
jgi:putative heme-binding domain-containing protein